MAFEPDPAELERRLQVRLAQLAAAHRRIDELRGKLEKLEQTRQKLKAVREERDALRNSAEYWLGRKLIRPFRKLLGKREKGNQASALPKAEAGISYHQWRLTQLPTAEQLREMAEESRQIVSPPLISILMPVYNTPPAMLEEAVDSVCAQAYENWELIAVDDASPEAYMRPLLERLGRKDPRIVVHFLEKNAGIALASNEGLGLAKGDFVAFLDHDDWLEPDALLALARQITAYPDADFIYSDEDKVDEAGYFQQPFFKPDWSPDALLASNYLCHFSAIRRSLVQEIGGFCPGFDGAQDYDLFLRATERARRIVHVPRVLYHWRISPHSTAQNSAQKPEAVGHGAKALEEAIRRRGLDAAVEPGAAGARYRVRYRISDPKKISIIIPTRDQTDLLARCLDTLAKNTDWPNYDVLILDNDSATPAARQFLQRTKHRVVKYEGPFNFAAICNFGVRESTGEWLLFLNNDTEFTEAGWLSAMAEHIQRPEVGAVGAKLLYPDGTVQHAGVVLAAKGTATHAYAHAPGDSWENGGYLQQVRNYSAVTAACMLTRRDVFQQVGGFDEHELPVSFNDLDYCLKLRQAGYQIVYTPYAQVYHHESASRGRGNGDPAEARTIRARWPEAVAHDPFSNPSAVFFARLPPAEPGKKSSASGNPSR